MMAGEAPFRELFDRLRMLGVPPEVVEIPAAAAMWLMEQGGPDPLEYWPRVCPQGVAGVLPQQRAEFFLAAVSTLSLSRLMMDESWDDARMASFLSAFCLFTKSFAQNAASIDALVDRRCYCDALSVVRTLHGRVYLLALFALEPSQFEEWLPNPNQSKFRDVEVRKRLKKRGLYVFPHLYREYSEIAHGNYPAQRENGVMERGLFPETIAMGNKVYVAAKLLFHAAGSIGLSFLVIYGSLEKSEKASVETLQRFLDERIAPPFRWDHVLATVAEDRHWEADGEGNSVVSQPFDPAAFRRVLQETARSGSKP